MAFSRFSLLFPKKRLTFQAKSSIIKKGTTRKVVLLLHLPILFHGEVQGYCKKLIPTEVFSMFIDVNQFLSCECDSDMIQAALDLAKETGESVVVPKYNRRTGKDVWDITKTILLHDESILLLQNAHLRLGDGVFCNMFSNTNARTPLAMQEEGQQKNITIRGIGKAVLDGGIHNGLFEDNGISRKNMKPAKYHISVNCMLYFQNVENLVLENFTIQDQRYWAVCLYSTTYSRVSNIHLISHSNVPNQDGVDLLKGCHDVIIENITGCTGDNAVSLLATDDPIYARMTGDLRKGDIYNVTIRNIMVYGVGGCSLVRLLNHDGFRIYNIRIDNLIETSPWSREDASVALNPDLNTITDDEGNIIPTPRLIPGEKGYRCEAAIIIGESYWYSTEKAKPGDTYGISVSNVMTHARYALFLNNTLQDSTFENIRLFGNGFMAVHFGEGTMENLRFSNIRYDKDCAPLPDDEHIFVEWNNTRSDGFSCVYFQDTNVKNVVFRDLYCASPMQSVFGGQGKGDVLCENMQVDGIPVFSNAAGVSVEKK